MGKVWRNVKLGAGGYVTGLDMVGPTKVIRTDTYGAYCWEPNANKWRQMVTSATIPHTATDYPDISKGVSEIRIAPSDPDRLYMRWVGTVWVSRDRGYSWTRTSLDFTTNNLDESANDTARYWGQKMAVDPVNPDIVYCGTPQGGVYRTFNAGATWTQISTGTIPACNTTFSSGVYPGHCGICFDPTSGHSGSRTNTIYVPVYGGDIYQSTDAGETWSALTGGNTTVRYAKIAIDGTYFANQLSGANWRLFRWDGSWAEKSPAASDVWAVVCDPQDADRVIAVRSGSATTLSQDGGETWGTVIASAQTTRLSPTIPWLTWTNVSSLDFGGMDFDPEDPTTLWLAFGVGTATGTYTGAPTSQTWTFNPMGIENMTTNNVVIPPGQKTMLACWDRPVFRLDSPETYPSQHGPDNVKPIRMAWDIDYAKSDPTFLAYPGAYLNDEGFGWKSTDAGVTWSAFSTPSGGTIPVKPSGTWSKIGGSIACATPLNWVLVPSNNALPWVTQDGGSTWTELNLTDMPTSGRTGYGHSYNARTQSVTADHVNVGTFYIYNYRYTSDGDTPSYTGTQSLWRSTDNGVNWTKMNSANIDTSATTWWYQLKAVPDNAGHLFLSGGTIGSIHSDAGATDFMRSEDGGATWRNVGTDGGVTINEPYCHGFGKAAPGQTYPAIYMVGWVNSVFGIWRSIDDCATWESLGDQPAGWLKQIKCITGSMDEYGLVYVGTTSAGFFYRTEAMQFGRLR